MATVIIARTRSGLSGLRWADPGLRPGPGQDQQSLRAAPAADRALRRQVRERVARGYTRRAGRLRQTEPRPAVPSVGGPDGVGWRARPAPLPTPGAVERTAGGPGVIGLRGTPTARRRGCGSVVADRRRPEGRLHRASTAGVSSRPRVGGRGRQPDDAGPPAAARP